MYLDHHFSLKKAATILLLALLLFNFIGYRVMFYYAEKQADQQTETLLDQELYDEEDLITIEVPLSNPYQTNQSEFERISGEITLDGIIYKYVKRKISNGTLILMCLPDKKKTPLKNAKEDFFKKTNDLGRESGKSDTDQSKASFFKGLFAEYEQHLNELFILPYSYTLSMHELSQPGVILSSIIDSPEQPPDFI